MKLRFIAVMTAVGLIIGIQAAQAQGLQGSALVAGDPTTIQSTNGSLHSVERKNAKGSKLRVPRWTGTIRGWYSLSVGRAIEFFNRGVDSSVVSEPKGTVEIAATTSPKAAIPPSAQPPQFASSLERTNGASIRRILEDGDLAGPQSDVRFEDAMSRAQVIQPYVAFDDSQINILATMLR
jgi:hypothetical protein